MKRMGLYPIFSPSHPPRGAAMMYVMEGIPIKTPERDVET